MSRGSYPILDCAEAILVSVEDLMRVIKPAVTRPERPRVALYMSIAEQFECALYLARAGAGSHSAVHVRSMVEALITMNLLGIEKDYVNQVKFDNVKGKKTLHERLLVDPNLPVEHQRSFQDIVLACQEEM